MIGVSGTRESETVIRDSRAPFDCATALSFPNCRNQICPSIKLYQGYYETHPKTIPLASVMVVVPSLGTVRRGIGWRCLWFGFLSSPALCLCSLIMCWQTFRWLIGDDSLSWQHVRLSSVSTRIIKPWTNWLHRLLCSNIPSSRFIPGKPKRRNIFEAVSEEPDCI